MLVGNPLAVPKPRLELHLEMPHNAAVRQESNPEAPALKVYAVPPDFPLALTPTVDSPHLPVPMSSSLLASAHAPRSSNQTANSGGEQAGDPSGPSGLLVVGVDPSGVARLLALPPGNRYGDFAISPAGGQPGSPGGGPGGVEGGGTGGGGNGGDGSTGVGSGGSGGGGGGSGMGGGVTIAGGSGTDGGFAGSLAYSPPNNSLLPVLVSPQIRKNNLIVFTGPMGGGGLGVYQALSGGKIYTKFLPMPGKSWVLQYCVAEKAAARSAPRPRGEVVQLDQGLVPPEVLERYDFERVPIPEEKAGKLIVLRGVIQADGSVAELKLYRGVQSDMDQAAVAAFSRWKFKPALRANQPVAVEILVGIPARLPKS
ncbi:MAG TPA: energy transducer TonB [Candidatus Acidoferrales bacterium]|nr:energy transducer TonB [Candidatus Acidoferrales bacterium]